MGKLSQKMGGKKTNYLSKTKLYQLTSLGDILKKLIEDEGEQERSAQESKREIERQRRHATQASPADSSRDSRPSQGAPSPSPLRPHPSQVPPAAQVGGRCTPAYEPLDRKTREDIGRPSAGEMKTSDGQTMKGQTLLEGGG